MHLQLTNASGFEKTIDQGKATSKSDAFLGVGIVPSPPALSKVAATPTLSGKLSFYQTAPEAISKDDAPTQWLATGLLDNWVHTKVLQPSIEQGWQTLTQVRLPSVTALAYTR